MVHGQGSGVGTGSSGSRGVVSGWFSAANPVGSLALLSLLPLAATFPLVFAVRAALGGVSQAVRR